MDEPLGALDAEFREHMAEELRALHDRMGATTVYVTHDQLEAMQMGDKIVVMNHGVVEQFGVPQDIYDWPATMFVANFIGSPPMNFLPFDGVVPPGADRVSLDGAEVAVPVQRDGASGALVLGVRPEHVRLDDAAPYRAEVVATEYLGTTQIVTLRTARGDIKARLAADRPVRAGETTGLAFDARTLTVFEAAQGRALRSAGQREGAPWLRSRSRASPRPSARSPPLDDVTMTIPDGSFVVLLGPTGAGKTTTLRLISGLDRPDRGEMLIGRPPGHRPDPGAAQRRDGLPAVFALPAPHGAREPRLPAEVADPAHARPPRSSARSAPSPRCCRSPTSSTTRRPPSPAARCSASRSAGRWCATPRST